MPRQKNPAPAALRRQLLALGLLVSAARAVPACAAEDHAATVGSQDAAAGTQLAVASRNALRLVLEHHQFSPAELHARAGKPIVIVLENRDDTPEEFECRKLRKEYGLRGHRSGTFTIRPQPAGRYEFTGEFHADTARGVLVVQ